MDKEQKSIYGLIGYPVEHSLSPLMHNAAFKALKLDAAYKLFSLKEEELEDFFKKLKEKNSPIFGLNVTVPYKEKVIKYLDSLSPYAEKTMAVNTITISPARVLQGHNTDGPGFLTHLTELGVATHGKKVAILGAGGSARAILSVLCLLPERPASIKIYNHHKPKADELVRDLKNRMDLKGVEVVLSVDDLDIPKADLLINTTPLGMKKGDPALVDENLLHKNLFVYDLVYNVSETALMKLAEKKGAKASNGLGMLFYQGVLAFQRWADADLDKKVKQKMRDALTQGLSK